MKDILTGNFAVSRWHLCPPQSIRVVDWNINRGLRLPEIVEFLSSHQSDLLVLQEVDLNARRTHWVNVAEELARKLRMNYIFGREFQELTQGSRTSAAYHGQATLSPWRLRNPRVIRFGRQSGFWRPRWFLPNTEPFQERLGGRIALVTEIEMFGRTIIVYNLHLESRGNNDLRLSQLNEVLADAARNRPGGSILVAGDLNCDVSNTVAAPAIRDAGFRNALAARATGTTPAHGLLQRSRSIDWAFASGPVEPILGRVHTNLDASDHYPLSFSLRFR